MNGRNRAPLLVSTLLALALSASPTLAAPDTSVANKLNYSTDVIYQIVTDRFVDGSIGNNPAGSAFSASCTQRKLYCGGDWKGVQNKIEDGYLTGMGITAIWISPTVEQITAVLNYSGIDSTAYHGYWARDFKKTNPAFGSFTDFSNMIAAAHLKGIKVIIDFAPNHSSPAAQADPAFAENGKLYDNGALLGSYANDPIGYFHHSGGTDFSTLESGIYKNLFDLADLNHNAAQVDAYFKSAIKVWLELGIDGIRFDAVKHMPFGWQKSLFGTTTGTQAAYTQTADLVTFIDNHDMPRFQLSGASGRKLEQALAFTLTSRGVPAIYYGTEQYLTGTGDPDNRARMSSFNIATTAYKLVGKLAPLRKSNPALAYGTTVQHWVNSDILIYERKFGPNVVLVAINRSQINEAPISGLITALPAGNYVDVINFKFIKKSVGSTIWEGGGNHTFTTPASGTATVRVGWQD